MIVAPILSILAWYAVGHLVGEKPQAAEEGKLYKLVARSNCRYESGSCDLHNADFQLTIQPEMLTASSVALTMTSSHSLQSAVLSLVEGDLAADRPAPMTAKGDNGMIVLQRKDEVRAILRIVKPTLGFRETEFEILEIVTEDWVMP